MYCKIDIVDESIVDFCERCGYSTFGEKMFKTIVQNMTDAEQGGDLFQG